MGAIDRRHRRVAPVALEVRRAGGESRRAPRLRVERRRQPDPDRLPERASTDPAEALLLTSSTNTLDSIVTGVSIDLKSTSEDAAFRMPRSRGAPDA